MPCVDSNFKLSGHLVVRVLFRLVVYVETLSSDGRRCQPTRVISIAAAVALRVRHARMHSPWTDSAPREPISSFTIIIVIDDDDVLLIFV